MSSFHASTISEFGGASPTVSMLNVALQKQGNMGNTLSMYTIYVGAWRMRAVEHTIHVLRRTIAATERFGCIAALGQAP